jgi:hypothetical protein
VHLLLEHLERSGFDGAPRVLGFDDQGREVLSFLDGDRVAGDGLPAWVWTHKAVPEAGRLIRRYHDACRSFNPPPGAHWQVIGRGTGDRRSDLP